MDTERDHIFVSYASEDVALAEWLARKLTAAGYGVWMDRLKLLGGDRWPKKIDEAIRDRSFCLIQLVTDASIEKPNPSKERQLAFYIENERKITFFIPLNVGGIPAAKLPWQLSDIQYIPFQDWASGLNGLLAALTRLGCPRLWGGDGSALAIRSYFPERAVKQTPETIYSNCYPVLHVPSVIQRYHSVNTVPYTTAEEWAVNSWPNYYINSNTVLAFLPPPTAINRDFMFKEDGSECWVSANNIDSVPTRNIAIALVRSSFNCCCRRRCLQKNDVRFYWYFPAEAVPSDGNLRFRCYTGKETWIRVRGTRNVRGEILQYALAFVPSVRYDIGDSFTVQIKIRLRLSNQFGIPLDIKLLPSRRKAITANWWNHEWLLRQEAIIAYMSQDRDHFGWGNEEKTSVIFSAKCLQGKAPSSLDDEYLDKLKVAGKTEAQIRAETAESIQQEEGHDDTD